MHIVITENLVGKRVRATDLFQGKEIFESEVRAMGLNEHNSFVLLILQDDGVPVTLQCLGSLKILSEEPETEGESP